MKADGLDAVGFTGNAVTAFLTDTISLFSPILQTLASGVVCS